MFSRTNKSSKAGFGISVDDGQDIEFQVGNEKYYLLDIIEEIDEQQKQQKKIMDELKSKLEVWVFGALLAIVIFVGYTVPNRLFDINSKELDKQTHQIEYQDAQQYKMLKDSLAA